MLRDDIERLAPFSHSPSHSQQLTLAGSLRQLEVEQYTAPIGGRTDLLDLTQSSDSRSAKTKRRHKFMPHTLVRAFLSRSFEAADKLTCDWFEGICKGFGIHCVNLSNASSSAPATEARDLIDTSDLVIAVATKDVQLG